MLRSAILHLFQGLTAALLAVIVAITTIDVVGRYVLNRPLAGAFELTELLMGALLFAALPLVTLRREHIVVDILDPYVPARLQRIQEVLVQAASGVIQFVLAWVLVGLGAQQQADGLYTHALKLPLAPVVYFAAAATAIAGVLHFALVAAAVAGRERVEAG
jgi:TRAP-type C4-dicarboxylate transport system permease small subunit